MECTWTHQSIHFRLHTRKRAGYVSLASFFGLFSGFVVFGVSGVLSEREKGVEERERANAELERATPAGGEIFAAVTCPAQIERLARYGVRWVDGILKPKISRFGWKNQEEWIATYVGDRVEFQNGFGAWQPHVYECDVNVRSRAVVAVRANPGRLD